MVCRFCRFDLRTGQPVPAPVGPEGPRREVIVTDVSMSFGSMVGFMVKWAIAAIPAIIILWVIGIALFGFLAAFFGLPHPTLFGMWRRFS